MFGKLTTKENETSVVRNSLSQVVAVMVLNTLMMGYGMIIGFPTILIPRLVENNSDDNIYISEDDKSWIASIGYLCIPLGCLLSGTYTALLGRKICLQIVCIPFILSALAFRFYITTVWEIHLSLAIVGIFSGFLEAPVLTYIGDVTQPNFRCVLSGTATFAIQLGTLLEFILGTFFHWRTVAFINGAMPVVSFVLLLCIPESPQWLISKNKVEKAKRSLAWYRGWTTIDKVEKELEELIIEDRERLRSTENQTNFISDYTKKDFVCPLLLVGSIFLIEGFSSRTTIETFAVEIFSSFKVPLDNYHATIIYGVVLLLGNIPCILLIHQLGKRILMFSSLAFGGIGVMVLSRYAFITDVKYVGAEHCSHENSLNESNWIPLATIYIASFSLQSGISQIPWMLIGEVFPRRTNAVGSGIAAAMHYIVMSISNNVFFLTITSITLPGTFFLYGVVCFIGLILFYFWLPETEGMPLQEISNWFSGVSKVTADGSKHGSKN